MSIETNKGVDTTPNKDKKISMKKMFNIGLLSILLTTSGVGSAKGEDVTPDKWGKINELQTDIEFLNQEATDNHCGEKGLNPNCMEIIGDKIKKLNEMSKLINKQAMDILNTPIRINK